MIRILNKEARRVLDELSYQYSPNESLMKEVLIINLKMLMNIQQLLQKTNKKSKVYTRPTGNKKDIIIGEKPSGGYSPKKNNLTGKILPPKGGTGETKK